MPLLQGQKPVNWILVVAVVLVLCVLALLIYLEYLGILDYVPNFGYPSLYPNVT